MRKIISLYQRNYDTDRQVRDEIVPGAEWVISGEGVATRKWDGTPVMFDGKYWYKRYDVKKGRSIPDGAIPCQDPDPITGHWPHWVRVSNDPDDRWIRECILNSTGIDEGTYEAVGPRINGGNDGLTVHQMMRHGDGKFADCPRNFNDLKLWFLEYPNIEGVVWHHSDGRMVKIKRKDFGLPWPPTK